MTDRFTPSPFLLSPYRLLANFVFTLYTTGAPLIVFSLPTDYYGEGPRPPRPPWRYSPSASMCTGIRLHVTLRVSANDLVSSGSD